MIVGIKKKARFLVNKNKHFSLIYSSLNKSKRFVLKSLSDELFLKLNYYENTGFKLDLVNPVLFNEKLIWLKINYRTPLMTQCSDKVEVHKYLKDIGLAALSNDIIAVYDHAEDIPFDTLKGKYFLKCNHVSGINAIFDSERDFCRKQFVKKFNNAIDSNYYYQSREWNYKNIVPKILIERFLETDKSLLDFRFFCFNGKVKLIFVDIETTASDGSHSFYAKRNIYDRDFNLQDYTVGRQGFDPNLVKKPKNLDFMIECAEKISKPFPFCRVDLYDLNGITKFGEITFYPGGAAQQFSSREKDIEVASWITIV